MKQVLVVEDNKENMYLIRYILENSGFMVIEARNGLGGIELALAKSPDLILMDIQLPDINGFDAVRRIRESAANGDIPIVAVTSYAMPGDRQKALDAGCNGYIEKPINPKTVITEIKRYL
ncbi:MAG: response regulator [SAR324 cluster bacterium]|nr:response regulator [SAR324 cluster bacterium]